MNRIATTALLQRREGFLQAEHGLKLPPVIIEKDFWVCWMLGLLFGQQDWCQALVFKGGTALSKVFGVIRRFSEDIDLSLAPAALGIAESDVEQADTRRKRDHWMESMESLCCAWVDGELRPALELAVQEVLGMPARDKPWLEFERDAASHSPVIYFHYPCTIADGLPYIRRFVKLEFGSLTDQRPTGRHLVRPWLADVLPSEMAGMGCEVVALEIERSFWEKATILHAEHHRDAATLMPERYSRHYADLAALGRSVHSNRAVAEAALRQRVVDWKAKFFARSWARYDLAKPGTFRLLPPDTRMAELERDYREMRQMFLDEPVEFSTIMATLKSLENQINRGA